MCNVLSLTIRQRIITRINLQWNKEVLALSESSHILYDCISHEMSRRGKSIPTEKRLVVSGAEVGRKGKEQDEE